MTGTRKTKNGNGAETRPGPYGWYQDAIEVASDTANESLEGARTAVRTRPLAACLLSISAGAIIGALLLR